MVRAPGRTRLAFAFPLFAALGCNALIGADEPRLRQEDAAATDGIDAGCVLNSNCANSADGHVCIFRICSPPCRADVDCATGSRCLQTAAGTACVTNLVSICGAAGSCPAGSICQGASCRNACGAAGTCLSQQDCVGGVCVGTDPAHDPGVDGGGPDASLDQSAEDASVDQSAGDGGASDEALEAEPDTGADAAADAGGDATVQPGTDAGADGGCGDTSSDPRHCGSCSHDCTALPHVSGPVTCGASGQCAFALSSCAPGWTHCSTNPDQGCETSISTTSNCGACGNGCPSADPVCSGSGSAYSCVTGCSAPTTTLCSNTCVNTVTDPGNCATCGHACTGVTHGQPACSGSVCSIQCSNGYSDCTGACVDETSDDSNCGACGHGCSGGEHCVSSVCQCTGGQHLCGTTCVANDTSACGASCTLCAAPSGGTVSCSGTGCVQACTVATDAVCSDTCVDESSNTGNCGTCGHACTGSTPFCVNSGCVECTSGAQCAAGNTPQTCVNNQWVSQTACSGTTPVCANGGCVQCTSGAQCANGWVQTCSGNQWVNQTMCTSSQVCRAAACVNAVHDVGQDTALSSTFTLSADYMYLFRLPQLAHSAKVLGFGAYGTPTTSANAKMALYADDGTGTAPTGAPLDWIGTFLALSSGQVQQAANTTGTLAPSTYYWLGINVSTSTSIYSQSSSGVGTGFSQPYATYPSGMAGSSYSGIDLAIYVNVQDLN